MKKNKGGHKCCCHTYGPRALAAAALCHAIDAPSGDAWRKFNEEGVDRLGRRQGWRSGRPPRDAPHAIRSTTRGRDRGHPARPRPPPPAPESRFASPTAPTRSSSAVPRNVSCSIAISIMSRSSEAARLLLSCFLTPCCAITLLPTSSN